MRRTPLREQAYFSIHHPWQEKVEESILCESRVGPIGRTFDHPNTVIR